MLIMLPTAKTDSWAPRGRGARPGGGGGGGGGGTQSRQGYTDCARSCGCREQKLLKKRGGADCPVIMNVHRELLNLFI